MVCIAGANRALLLIINGIVPSIRIKNMRESEADVGVQPTPKKSKNGIDAHGKAILKHIVSAHGIGITAIVRSVENLNELGERLTPLRRV